MKKIFHLVALFASIAVWFTMPNPATAQTTYTQTMPVDCQLDDYVCHVPMTSGTQWAIIRDAKDVPYGTEFQLYLNGVVHVGEVSGINVPFPVLPGPNFADCPASRTFIVVCSTTSGVDFLFGVANGISGEVSNATVEIFKTCNRFCWPVARIVSSTLTVN